MLYVYCPRRLDVVMITNYSVETAEAYVILISNEHVFQNEFYQSFIVQL